MPCSSTSLPSRRRKRPGSCVAPGTLPFFSTPPLSGRSQKGTDPEPARRRSSGVRLGKRASCRWNTPASWQILVFRWTGCQPSRPAPPGSFTAGASTGRAPHDHRGAQRARPNRHPALRGRAARSARPPARTTQCAGLRGSLKPWPGLGNQVNPGFRGGKIPQERGTAAPAAVGGSGRVVARGATGLGQPGKPLLARPDEPQRLSGRQVRRALSLPPKLAPRGLALPVRGRRTRATTAPSRGCWGTTSASSGS